MSLHRSGHFILATGLVLFFGNLVVALFKGKKAEQNPWGGVTLEWQIPTPPPLENFAEIPTITERPYIFNPEAPDEQSLRRLIPRKSHKDYEGSKLGMWLFLFTEILLFGGLFHLYSAYRARYPMEFHDGGQHLNVVIGVANTVILLTSSLTVALVDHGDSEGEPQDCPCFAWRRPSCWAWRSW